MRDRSHDVFKALADGHRRRILTALCDAPMVAGELGRLVSLAPNAVSFHLKELRQAGLIRAQREGRFLRYHADATALDEWRSRVKGLFLAASEAASAPSSPATAAAGPGRIEHADDTAAPVVKGASPDDLSTTLPAELL